jgi:hypothetical protein
MAGRLHKLRLRLGIAAPRVAVRSHPAWYWRWLGVMLLLGVSAALAVWMYDAGRRFAGFDRGETETELAGLRRDMDTARSELERLRAIVNAADAKAAIERTAQAQLAQQIRGLENDNARLREELAVLESMLSADARNAQPLSIQRFKVESDAMPGEYRYRMLLLAGGRRDRDFQGRLELSVSVQQDGKNAMMTLPEKGQIESAAFRIGFRHFQRVEGVFRVNAKARVQTVQARVYETGVEQPRATQSVTPGAG